MSIPKTEKKAMRREFGVPCITVAPKPKGRPVGTIAKGLREKAWRSMRHLRQFTLNDLLDTNAVGGEKDAPSNLQKYIFRLESYGVLLRLDRRAPGEASTSNGYVIWTLCIDLGWEPPVWRQAEKVLWNPNTNAPVAMPAPKGDQHD
ncbi:MAG: hypothetical protein ABI606_05305 [Rhodoferax sp.]